MKKLIKRLAAQALRRQGYEIFYASAPALKGKRRDFNKSPETFLRNRKAMQVGLSSADGSYQVDGFWHAPEHHYVPDFYGANAHKHLDIRELEGFGQLAKQARAGKRALLHYDRLYILYQALQNVARRKASTRERVHLAEVGVFRGGTSHFLSLAAQQLGLDARLHGFDTFEGHAAQDLLALDTVHTGAQKFHDTGFESVREYLSATDGSSSTVTEDDAVVLHQGRFQDTCHRIEKLRFDMVHLDVDIYEPTRFALDFFDERLCENGIIVVDDYGFLTCQGARQAVDEFLQQKPSYTAFHLLTGQAVLMRGATPHNAVANASRESAQ